MKDKASEILSSPAPAFPHTMNDLRKELFEAMLNLKNGTLKSHEADKIAKLGQVIINSAKTEIEYRKMSKSNGLSIDIFENKKPEALQKTIKELEEKYK